MGNTELFYALASILGVLIQLLLIAASVILVYKSKNTGTVLMMLGSVLMLFNLMADFIFPIIFSSKGPEYLVKTIGLRQIAGQVPFLIYVFGALIYAIRIPKSHKNWSNSKK